ncbi:putative thiazole-containing bacteriocin maturation protein [Rossellomorea vietnamensis]|uniref:putative thiazole-containing bacteriocin maturation protein n=1 Tax=Rossellomorea vietnamensis TaxID=218284 RepID=UPI001E542F93|nr:putative thiazole-containing bacteriocin maturation protein [Rossellomorea vietnamensis]MCC5801860.1 putative thiazole-containing bacteriocin maturation protein [Rossellomorea vietnamensis]
MGKLNPSMRLKVKRDTFYLPERDSGVYFRNNLCSFRMEGSGIDQWVEKLLPMFNGEYSLEDLTDGLPDPYRNRVMEIAEVLLKNGFVRDVSRDLPHNLPRQAVEKFASQIEFVDSLADSGASRFETYRHANVLAAGSGSLLTSLVSSLIESGLAKLQVLVTDEVPTNRRRLKELVDHARKTDPEVELHEVEFSGSGWRETIRPYDSILYVTQHENLEELDLLHSICRADLKLLIPAICHKQTCIAGPIVHPDSEAGWESAWRRLHATALQKEGEYHAESAVPGAMMANMITFELFKEMTGVTKPDQRNRLFLLDTDTLEGSWHSFLPHPLETNIGAEPVLNLESRLEQGAERSDPEKLLYFFSLLTSKETGIFHVWEEGDTKQLPLAQCRVQPVDGRSKGPAALLDEEICSALTHTEARREAGLRGIERYASKLESMVVPHDTGEFMAFCTGTTFAECVGRGLEKCLTEELRKRESLQKNIISRLELDAMEDETCRFYLKALTTMQKEPDIALGEDLHGFPVVYVRGRNGWYGNTGFTITKALRGSLQQALFQAQNGTDAIDAHPVAVILEKENVKRIIIQAGEDRVEPGHLKEALHTLKVNQKQVTVYELDMEPAFKQELEGVFGVLLREEEA